MKNTKLWAVVCLCVSFVAASGAFASEEDGIIFDSRVAGGVYSSKEGAERSRSVVLDIGAVLGMGSEDLSHVQLEMELLTGFRDGGGQVIEGSVALKGRLMPNGKWGVELVGLPVSYERGGYYELSAVVISAVVRPVNTATGHQVEVVAGINPWTRRTYEHDMKGSVVQFDPVQMSEGYIYNPYRAGVDGAPSWQPSYQARGTWMDNSAVYFGGGPMVRSIETGFEMSERSFRVPVSIKYRFNDPSGRVSFAAEAYYVMRAGYDSLRQIDTTYDDYYGYVSYHNVHYSTCYDGDDRAYACNPVAFRYGGTGVVTDRRRNSTELERKDLFAHVVGGRTSLDVRLLRRGPLELLFTGQARAEYDSHLLDGRVGRSKESTTFIGTGGVILKF